MKKSKKKSKLIFNAQAARRERTDEAKARRRRCGDIGAKFGAKYLYPSNDGMSSCVTTSPTKDNMVIEYGEF